MSNTIRNYEIDTQIPSRMHFFTTEPLVNEPHEYRTAEEALSSPLAAKLFGFPWAEAVSLTEDRVSLIKADWVDWEDLADPLTGLINAHFESGEPIVIKASTTTASGSAMTSEQNWSVSIEATPNPATMKFQVNQVISDENYQIDNVSEAGTSPIAEKLFGFPWTEAVFIGRDFISVTKAEWAQWDSLAEPLSRLIQEHLESGTPVLLNTAAAEENSKDSEDVKKIKKVLNEEIRPAVAMDGGDIVFQRYEDQVVYLYMRGACAGCPSSTMTLKMGIEGRLQEVVPEIKEVVAL